MSAVGKVPKLSKLPDSEAEAMDGSRDSGAFMGFSDVVCYVDVRLAASPDPDSGVAVALCEQAVNALFEALEMEGFQVQVSGGIRSPRKRSATYSLVASRVREYAGSVEEH